VQICWSVLPSDASFTDDGQTMSFSGVGGVRNSFNAIIRPHHNLLTMADGAESDTTITVSTF